MMVASTQEILVPEVYRCYHCGSENTDSAFKYFDNKKVDQPRYKCEYCHKLFTSGSHGRLHDKTYAKKRNQDPEELKSLSRQCCHCGVADNALFKYYNNNNLSQPRFKCLSCKKQFQMRLFGTGGERRLVHTSSQKTRAPLRRKQGVFEPCANASSSSSEDASYQPFDGSFMPVSSDPFMPLEPDTLLLPQTSDEEAQFADFLEAELAQEDPTQGEPLFWATFGDAGNVLSSPSSDEALAYLSFVDAELSADENIEENIEVASVDAFSSTANVAGEFTELPSAWSDEASELMVFIDAGYVVAANVDTVSESTSNNVEVMYGTFVVDSPIASDSNASSDTATSDMSYADAAAACCHLMDMAHEKENSVVAVAPVQSIGSLCSVGSSMVYAHPFQVIPEQHLVQQALKEDEEFSDFQWNEDDTEMSSCTY